eukprot:TRINITY_DN90299_c0_g1_i1.p1 TRINITY_DN90299_c0_g1~~TRINITY_DN90299_c0_g1_i1.p1  ORF type:complete len:1213 (-),score=363.75 TRINITY_DN90299_c0_g1_i1:23-3661(-)
MGETRSFRPPTTCVKAARTGLPPEFVGRFLANKRVQEQVSEALRWLLDAHPGTDRRQVAADAARALVEGLSQKLAEARVQETLSGALAALLIDSDVDEEGQVPAAAAEAIGEEAAGLLARSIRRHLSTPATLTALGAALARLLTASPARLVKAVADAATNERAVDVLLEALWKHPSATDVQAEVCAAIAAVLHHSKPAFSATAARLGLGRITVQALRKHADDAAVQASASAALAALLEGHLGSAADVAKDNAATALMEAIRRHPESASLQAKAAHALAALLQRSPASAQQIAQTRICRLLLRALERHPEEEAVQARASAALAWMFTQHPRSLDDVKPEYTSRLLTRAIYNSPLSRVVQEGAGRALAVLLSYNPESFAAFRGVADDVEEMAAEALRTAEFPEDATEEDYLRPSFESVLLGTGIGYKELEQVFRLPDKIRASTLTARIHAAVQRISQASEELDAAAVDEGLEALAGLEQCLADIEETEDREQNLFQRVQVPRSGKRSVPENVLSACLDARRLLQERLQELPTAAAEFGEGNEEFRTQTMGALAKAADELSQRVLDMRRPLTADSSSASKASLSEDATLAEADEAVAGAKAKLKTLSSDVVEILLQQVLDRDLDMGIAARLVAGLVLGAGGGVGCAARAAGLLAARMTLRIASPGCQEDVALASAVFAAQEALATPTDIMETVVQAAGLLPTGCGLFAAPAQSMDVKNRLLSLASRTVRQAVPPAPEDAAEEDCMEFREGYFVLRIAVKRYAVAADGTWDLLRADLERGAMEKSAAEQRAAQLLVQAISEHSGVTAVAEQSSKALGYLLAQHPEACEAASKSTAVPLLLREAASWSELRPGPNVGRSSEGCYEALVYALAQLVWLHRASLEMYRVEVAAVLKEALAQRPPDLEPHVVRACALSLGLDLVTILRLSPASEPEEARLACVDLQWLLKLEAEHGTAGAEEADATEALLDALKQHSSNPVLLATVADTLEAFMALSAPCAARAAAGGVAELLLNAAAAAATDPSAVAEAEAPEGEEGEEEDAADAAPPPAQHSDEDLARQVASCFRAVIRLCKEREATAAEVAARGAVDVIVAAMKRHAGVEEVQCQSADFLDKVLSGHRSSAFPAFEAGAVELIEGAQKRFPRSSRLRCSARRTLWKLTERVPLEPTKLKSEVVPDPDSKPPQSQMAYELCMLNIAHGAGYQRRIMEPGEEPHQSAAY